jgi:hypothetical protein
MRAVLALMVMAGTAAAQPVRLVVTASTCTGLADKVARVATFASDAKAGVEIVETDLTATVTLDDGDGHTLGPRIIHAATCDELARSVAIVVSIALPAIADLPEPQPLPASDAIKVVIAAVKLKEPVPQKHDAEVARRFVPERRSSRDLAFVATLGMSSSLGTSLALGARWRWGATSIAGELAGTLPEDVAQSRVSIERASVAFVPCRHIGEFGVCGVLRVGIDRGAGNGLMDARSVVLPLVESGPRLAWEHDVTDAIALHVQAELDIDLTTSQFDIDQIAVWHSSRIAGLAGAGVVVRFP